MELLPKILVVIVMSVVVFLCMVLIRDNSFYKGQAIQTCNREIETIYEKDNNHFVVCSNGSIHRLLDKN
jgi:hypothetical protein